MDQEKEKELQPICSRGLHVQILVLKAACGASFMCNSSVGPACRFCQWNCGSSEILIDMRLFSPATVRSYSTHSTCTDFSWESVICSSCRATTQNLYSIKKRLIRHCDELGEQIIRSTMRIGDDEFPPCQLQLKPGFTAVQESSGDVSLEIVKVRGRPASFESTCFLPTAVSSRLSD